MEAEKQRLYNSALHLAVGYVEAGRAEERLFQEETLLNNYGDAFRAVVEEIGVCERDLLGLWRVAQKSRA